MTREEANMNLSAIMPAISEAYSQRAFMRTQMKRGVPIEATRLFEVEDRLTELNSIANRLQSMFVFSEDE